MSVNLSQKHDLRFIEYDKKVRLIDFYGMAQRLTIGNQEIEYNNLKL
jgi:hypothetical protein